MIIVGITGRIQITTDDFKIYVSSHEQGGLVHILQKVPSRNIHRHLGYLDPKGEIVKELAYYEDVSASITSALKWAQEQSEVSQ